MKVFLQGSGLVKFEKLLERYIGQDGQGVIEVELTEGRDVIGRAGSNISGALIGNAIPGHPRIQLWLAPELAGLRHDIYLVAVDIHKHNGVWIQFSERKAESLFHKYVQAN